MGETEYNCILCGRDGDEHLQIKTQWCAGQPASTLECDSERDQRKEVKDQGEAGESFFL